MQDPTFASLVELSAALENRRLSPVDLVGACLARIARRDPALHAFVAVYADEARLAAEGAERRLPLGPPDRAAPRHPGRAEGPGRARGPGHHRRIEAVGRPCLAGDRDPGPAPRRGGHDRAGQDPHGRVRDGRIRDQRGARHAVESLGPPRPPDAGRVVERLGCGGRRRARAGGGRHRHRRVGAPACILLRDRRVEGDRRPHLDARRPAALHDPRHAGADGALGRGRGDPLPRAPGPGPPRSADAARAARRSDAVASPRGGGAAPRRSAQLRACRDRRRGPQRLRSGDRGARAPRRAARADPAAADVPGLLRGSRPDLRARGLPRGRCARRGLLAPARPQRPRAHPPGPRGDSARLPRDAPSAGERTSAPTRRRRPSSTRSSRRRPGRPHSRWPSWTRRSPRRTSRAWRTTWGSAPSRCRTG